MVETFLEFDADPMVVELRKLLGAPRANFMAWSGVFLSLSAQEADSIGALVKRAIAEGWPLSLDAEFFVYKLFLALWIMGKSAALEQRPR